MSWPPPLFRSSKFFLGVVVSLTPNSAWRPRDYTSSGPCPLTSLTSVTLPEVYASASINLRFTREHKSSPHYKALVLEEAVLMADTKCPACITTDQKSVSSVYCRYIVLLSGLHSELELHLVLLMSNRFLYHLSPTQTVLIGCSY